MQPKLYAAAFDAAIGAGISPEEASANLVATAKRRGHKHLLSAILRACENSSKKAERARTVTVTSAAPLSEEALQGMIARANVGHFDHVVRRVDESLVSGSIIQKGSTRVDASGKKLLLDIYNKLTA